MQPSPSTVLPLLSSMSGDNATPSGGPSVVAKPHDGVVILDYSQDTTAEALFTSDTMHAINDNDPHTTLIPKVPTIQQVLNYLSYMPDENMNVNNIYGSSIKIAKLSTSDQLISYPQHANDTHTTNGQIQDDFSTAPTTFVDPLTGVEIPTQSKALYQLQQQQQHNLSPNPDSTTPNVMPASNLTTLQQQIASDAARRGAAMAMGTINVTADGKYYLMDSSLSNAIVDGVYSELSSSLGQEFVEYVTNVAKIPILPNNSNNNNANLLTDASSTGTGPSPTMQPGTPIQPPATLDLLGLDASSDNVTTSTGAMTPDVTRPDQYSNATSQIDDADQYNTLFSSLGSAPPSQPLSGANSTNNNTSKSIIGKKNIILKQKKTTTAVQTNVVDLSQPSSFVTPQTIYNQYDGDIDRELYKKFTNSTNTNTTNNNNNNHNNNSYKQPTFEPLPAPVGTSIAYTKDHEQNLYIPSVDEPLSKTTFEQITFLTGFWPQAVRFLVCALTGAVIAAITYWVEIIISKLVLFLHWVLTSILQLQEGQGIVNYGYFSSLFVPLAAMFAVTLLVIIYWIPGVIMVYYAGFDTLKGSGLSALNWYFSGSYDPALPMFSFTVLIAKLGSLVLSLGGLLKSGAQGPLITTGAMVARSMLKFVLKIISTPIMHQCFAYLCFCCFDRRGHSRNILTKLPFAPTNRSGKHTSYIQSKHEQDDLLDGGSDDNKNKSKKNNKANPKYYQQQTTDDDLILRQQMIDNNNNGTTTTTGNNNNNNNNNGSSYDDGNNPFAIDVERELREHNIKRYSPPTYGTENDVLNEMVNRINIFSNTANVEKNNSIITYQQNEELHALRTKQRTLFNQQPSFGSNNNNNTPLQTGYDGPQSYDSNNAYNSNIPPLNRGLTGNTSTNSGNITITTTNTSTVIGNNNNNNQQQHLQQQEQQQPIEYQYHHASKIATNAQHPSANGNDYQTVQSLTLSSRIELITKSLSGPQDVHDMIACGATAGFTCAFNAPMAGLVMVQAMLKQQFSFQLTLRMFFTALIAVVVSNLLRSESNLPDRGFLDLDIPQIHPMPASELYLCVLLGFVGGLLGVFIIKFNKNLTKWFTNNSHNKFLPNIQVSIALAMLMIIPGVILTVSTSCTPITEESFPICIDHPVRCLQLSCPEGQFSQFGSLMFGTPEKLLRLMWDRSNDTANEFNPIILTTFFILYILLASASFLGPYPGGMFLPAIIIGAMFGRIFSRFVNYIFPQYYFLSIGVYATLGSVAMLASINRITLPIVAMMVEFTSDVQFLTPIMIVILCAKFIADFFCLGLEAEVNKLQPRVTMAMADEMNPILGHITAKDILTINSTIHGYSQTSNNNEIYPGSNDFAVIGEIDSIHRIQALLEMTTHSAFPVVTVLPQTINSKLKKLSTANNNKQQHTAVNNNNPEEICEHHYITMSVRIYLRSLLKTLLQSINKDNTNNNTNTTNNNNDNIIILSQTTLSLLQQLVQALPNKTALHTSILNQINKIISNATTTTTTTTTTSSSSTLSNTELTRLLTQLQSYYDDLYLTTCPCCNATNISSNDSTTTTSGTGIEHNHSLMDDNTMDDQQYGKFIGLITRRNLLTIVEKSVDYTRAIRIINTGNLRNLYNTNEQQISQENKKRKKLQKQQNKKQQPSQQNNNGDKKGNWWSRLTKKFASKAIEGNGEQPYILDGVSEQIAANRREEQLDLVQDDDDTTNTATNNNDTNDGNSNEINSSSGNQNNNTSNIEEQRYDDLSHLNNNNNGNIPPSITNNKTQQQQQQRKSTTTIVDLTNTNKHQIKCQCLRCTTHHWALIRYHTPILALLQHQTSKKRLFPLIAYLYLKLSLILKRYVYKYSIPNPIQCNNNTTTSNNNKNNNLMYTLQHPVLLHRELLSTVLNYITSAYVKLPQLPYFIQDNILRLASQTQHELQQQQKQHELYNSNGQPRLNDSLEEVISNVQQYDNNLHVSQSSTITTSPTSFYIPDAELEAQSNNNNKNNGQFGNDPKLLPPLIRFVTFLEERSKIRKTLPPIKTEAQKERDRRALHIQNAELGISASTLCVSLVNVLPLVDHGVYTAPHNTSGARLWRQFRSVGMAKIVIVNDNNIPIGVVSRKDMVRADKYLTAQLSTISTKLKQE